MSEKNLAEGHLLEKEDKRAAAKEALDNITGGASDSEVAARWVGELANPCYPPGQPELHVGDVYLREAKSALEAMKEKPDADRNTHAVELLENAIRQYEEKKSR